MFDDDFLKKLRKYKIPYHKTENSLSFPTPAYQYDDTLRWIRRKCPSLYYKITGECRKRPYGYRWEGRMRPVKKRYREICYQMRYAEFYGSHDKVNWTKLATKLVINNTVEAPIEILEYEHKYVSQFMKPVFEKIPVRRLAI